VVIVVRVLEGDQELDEGPAHERHQAGPRGRIAGVFSPKPIPVDQLGPGEVGFIACGIKVVSDAQIGDTVTDTARRREPFRVSRN
jgi:GTP-binding protein LepA